LNDTKNDTHTKDGVDPQKLRRRTEMLLPKKMYALFFLIWVCLLFLYHQHVIPLMVDYPFPSTVRNIGIAIYGFPLGIIGMEFVVWRISEVTQK